MNRVFIDTDVIIDLFIDRKPHHEIALEFFTIATKYNVALTTSPIVIANTYYLLSKIKNKTYALEKVRDLRKIMKIVPINEMIIDLALSTPYKDFEDTLQYYCALESKISYLITRNVVDYQKDKMEILQPVEYIKMIKNKQEN